MLVTNHFRIDTSEIKRFSNENPKKVRMANDLVGMSGLVAHCLLRTDVGGTCCLLVQEVYRHFQEALLFAMRGEPRMSLSMGRIASEGCRDLLRLIEAPSREELYFKGRDSEDRSVRENFRKTFRFKIPEETHLHSLYDMGSDFGIHARIPICDADGHILDENGTSFVNLSQKSQQVSVLMVICSTLLLSMPSVMIAAKDFIRPSPEAHKIAVDWRRDYEVLEPEFSNYMLNWRKRQLH